MKGKDKCPLCLQHIADPQHIMKHYNDEIGTLESRKVELERERTSILQKQKTASEKLKYFDNLERELERRVSKSYQLNREKKSLGDLTTERKTIEMQIRKNKKDIDLLIKERNKLGFDSTEYSRLDEKVKKLRKKRIAENYANAKTELNRLPTVNQELETSKDTLSALVNNKRTLEGELRQLVKIEEKYIKAKQLFDAAQTAFNNNNILLAKETERERQAKEDLMELEKKEQKLKKNLKQIEQLKEEISTLEELRGVFKNIPENILRRLRPFIEKEGTDIINELSNSEITTLNIEEETLNVAATMNGEVRPIHYFSGGQKTRINMALRVAISRILSKLPQTEEHAFATMQTLFIDEGDFGNLDEAGIREAIAVVRNLTKEFNRVILVSHVDAIREIFQGYTIEILKKDIAESGLRVSGLTDLQTVEAPIATA